VSGERACIPLDWNPGCQTLAHLLRLIPVHVPCRTVRIAGYSLQPQSSAPLRNSASVADAELLVSSEYQPLGAGVAQCELQSSFEQALHRCASGRIRSEKTYCCAVHHC
jgi:hypothetical protein